MTGFVYKWKNIINDMWYIGSHKGTTDDNYRHSSKRLLAAENKYGIENFVREILFEGHYEKDCIKQVESDFLKKVDAANNSMSYNLTNITGPNCWSEETNRKRSVALKGTKRKPFTGEHKQKLSLAKKGRKRPDVSKRLQGRKRPDITKALSGRIRNDISMALKGRANPNKCKALIIGGVQYPSRKTAAELLQVSENTIRRWIKTGRNQSFNQIS